MIISKTPYRIPISGGGTDLDFFYRKNEGLLTSLAINQYVYVFFKERLIEDNYFIQTSVIEFKKKLNDINHDLIRETLKYFKIKKPVHVGTYSTIPTRTGLGTSSAMVVGLINCIKKYKNLKLSNTDIIKHAYMIERKICEFYGGWQDQIISQLGGYIKIKISRNEKFKLEKIKINKNIKKVIENNLLLIYTYKQRNSHLVSKSQKNNIKNSIKHYKMIKNLNNSIIKSLDKGKINDLGSLFNTHWDYKKKLSGKITNLDIDNMYNKLRIHKYILGGKLIGAGGGGFFLVVTKNKKNALDFWLKIVIIIWNSKLKIWDLK